MSLSAPIAVGTASVATAALTADLGKVYLIGGKEYRLVKAAAGISSAAGFALVTALSSGVPTWSVNTTTTANNHLCVGLVPIGQTGSTGTADLISGDIFLVQKSGPAKIVSAAAIAAGALVGTSTTAGKCDDASITAGVGAIGVALEAASGADENTDVFLKGI